jgi:hypothetical protein
MSVPESDRSGGFRRIWPISRRLRLRSAIVAIAIASVPLAIIVPRVHILSEAETRAIRIVTKHYATMYSKSPDSLKATRLPDGGWTVEATAILNPEPGGYRSVDTFQVDVDWKCHWISLRAGGVF